MTDMLMERRDHVIERLSSGYAGDAFDVDELDRRLALAHTAKTPAELDALVTDLAPAATSTALVPVQRLRVVMGSVERGPRAMPSELTARVLWGSLVLDLREAVFAPGGTTIDLHVTMGSVEVIVAPGTVVEVGASSFLGSVEDRAEHASPGAPVVRVVGRVKLGSIEVETRRRGETARDARWRRRADRRARRRWRRMRHHHRALPPGWDW